VFDHVGVGVSRDESTVSPNESGKQGALVAVLSDAGYSPQQQGVVYEQEVRPEFNRFVNGLGHGIDSKKHTRDFGRGVTAHEAWSVPALCSTHRPESLDGESDLRE
jgi:hypothetical protein